MQMFEGRTEALLVRKVAIACRTAGFPKPYQQRGSLVVI